MFDWHEFLDLARQLEASSLNEAVLRTAISRAYYAAYHRASRHVRVAQLAPTTKRLTHELVWSLFAESSDERYRDVGDRGVELKLERIRADYNARYPGDLAKSARKAIDVSEAIIRLIDAL